MGGGLAGATLALQLRREVPDARVVVVEPRTGAAPEVTHKVGESVVELGSWYLRETLALRTHLRTEQLPKFGLRYFFSSGDNSDLARRLEFGPLDVARVDRPFEGLPLTTYNLDRGRLENHLTEAMVAAGAQRVTGRVSDIDLGPRGHRVRLRDGRTLRARWLVDASGRRGLLKRRLGLARGAPHTAHAAFFRVDGRVDVDTWSDDAGFHGRTRPGLRWLSTNHLVGRGYWVWLIPLPSGATSVGVVIDPRIHRFSELNTPDRAAGWLARHEPQLARDLLGRGRRDFRVVKGGAYGVRRAFSPDRWAVVGDAAAFVDPLYSPGTDFVAVGNTLVTRLVGEDLAGRRPPVGFAEALFQRLFTHYELVYRDAYAVMGSARAMAAKAVWDTAVYFGFNLLAFRNGALCDPAAMRALQPQAARLDRLQPAVQARLARWAEHAAPRGDGAVDQLGVGFLQSLYERCRAEVGPASLPTVLAENLDALERFSAALRWRTEGGAPPADRLDVGALWG